MDMERFARLARAMLALAPCLDKSIQQFKLTTLDTWVIRSLGEILLYCSSNLTAASGIVPTSGLYQATDLSAFTSLELLEPLVACAVLMTDVVEQMNCQIGNDHIRVLGFLLS